jgi:hypothetical protein
LQLGSDEENKRDFDERSKESRGIPDILVEIIKSPIDKEDHLVEKIVDVRFRHRENNMYFFRPSAPTDFGIYYYFYLVYEIWQQ